MEDSGKEVHRAGYRHFVGGKDEFWDRIGDLQFKFLLERGLSPHDVLIDVGCGSLRGGTRFIRYLEPAHYLGIDKYIELIIYGVSSELGISDFAAKQPQFVVSDTFEIEKFGQQPTFGIAQSLFTHLSERDLRLCLTKLKATAAPGCRFFATFFELSEAKFNPDVSHSHGFFGYTRKQMEEFGETAGWKPHYIGGWNHPRDQSIVEYANG